MLTRLRFENFKSWKNTGDIALKPITGIFGGNSPGKTSLIQALLLLFITDLTAGYRDSIAIRIRSAISSASPGMRP